MGVFKKNYLRDEWYRDIEKYLDVNAIRIEDCSIIRCPRCGLKMKAGCFEKSQYDEFYICNNCVEDEILRDSVGKEQADISRWYITTNEIMSYVAP